jgi:DNA ligase-associated metallophosphoesterase
MPETRADTALSFFDLPIEGQNLRLHAGRYAEWLEEKTLFVADVHLGKIAHFRRAGIGIPPQAGENGFLRLSEILQRHRPARMMILGDLFHSDFNEDFPRFAEWRKNHSAVDITLIPGNHDRSGLPHLSQLGIEIQPPHQSGPFFLQHEAGENEVGFLLHGHLHPGISLHGVGRQHLRMPAFWLQKHALCLPAFGTFTGLASISPDPEDVIFAIAGQRIQRIPAAILR